MGISAEDWMSISGVLAQGAGVVGGITPEQAQALAQSAAALGQQMAEKKRKEEEAKAKKAGKLGSIGSTLGQVVGSAAGFALGGPVGATIGAGLGSAAGGSAGEAIGGVKPSIGDAFGYGIEGAAGQMVGSALTPGGNAGMARATNLPEGSIGPTLTTGQAFKSNIRPAAMDAFTGKTALNMTGISSVFPSRNELNDPYGLYNPYRPYGGY